MEPKICQFVEEVANSLVRLEVLLFFAQNPSTTESAEGVAWRIYRDVEQIREAMAHLSAAGVLEAFELGQGRYRLYSLTEDPEMLRIVHQVAHYYYHDPEGRIQIVRRLVGRRPKPVAAE